MRFYQPLCGALLVGAAQAQQSAWGQCGGIGYTGQTTCVSGYHCVYSNDWYSQCIPGTDTGTGGTPTTSTPPSQPTTSSPSGPAATGLRWLGVDESGAEFGQTAIPGVYNKDFTFASTTTLGSLMREGYNIFRVPFLMERMAPGGVASAFSQAYLTNYTVAINYITQNGGYAVVDPHNYGRYNGAIITDTNAFGTFWTNLANAFKSNSKVIFDTNNEYHDMDQTLVLNLNQAAINAIRAAGATSQYIFAEGNSYSGAWTWATVNDNLKALTDPQNKLIYEMHQYLDSDGSGTSATCVSSTIGVDRVTSATAWLRANNKIGVLGEYAGGANSVCLTAIQGLLQHLKTNSDVWTGAIWWGGGPWWGTYIYSYEPPSGIAYEYYDSTILQFKP